MKTVFIISILMFTYCSCSAEIFIPEDIQEIFNTENITNPPYRVDKLNRIFSEEQIVWINGNKVYMRRYLLKKIEEGSVLAIKLAGQLGLDRTLPALRKRLLTLEGLIGSKAARYVTLSERTPALSDRLFPHHKLCITAITRLTEAPLSDTVALTPLERHYLEKLASLAVLPTSNETVDDNPVNDSAWCAKWLLKKLDIPNSDIEGVSR